MANTPQQQHGCDGNNSNQQNTQPAPNEMTDFHDCSDDHTSPTTTTTTANDNMKEKQLPLSN
ncbi:hypothetical protein BLOT_002612 [Blomia tropicalis]|nr:hypothetical protein BLOT_002612 [Blomia tropicalis]